MAFFAQPEKKNSKKKIEYCSEREGGGTTSFTEPFPSSRLEGSVLPAVDLTEGPAWKEYRFQAVSIWKGKENCI